jgi:TonB family protein
MKREQRFKTMIGGALAALAFGFGAPVQSLAFPYLEQSNPPGATEQVQLSEILIPLSATPSQTEVESAEKEAKSIVERVRAGAPFTEEAREHSKGPTASSGGNVGYFKRGVLAPAIEERVFSLQVGAITEPIRTKQGFVILKVTNHVMNEVKAPPQGAVDILSDTRGVDFGPYLKGVLEKVRSNWYNLIPDEARSPQFKQGKLAILFIINKNGNVEGMRINPSSGDAALDRAAWGGITASNPFSPLPKEFTGPYLALRFRFFYNPDRTPPELK